MEQIEYTDDLFGESSEFIAEGEVVMDEENKQEGLCPKCLNSGYLYTVQNGVRGLAFSVIGNDSANKPIKRLRSCNHGVRTDY